MILSRFTSTLDIKDKLRKIKSLVRGTKDRRDIKGYKQRIKANKRIGSRLDYYQYSL